MPIRCQAGSEPRWGAPHLEGTATNPLAPEDALQFRFRDRQTPPQKVAWLLSRAVHKHAAFESLAPRAVKALCTRVLASEHVTLCGDSRVRIERWLLPGVESCAIEQIIGVYKRLARRATPDPERLREMSKGIMTVLLQVHGDPPEGEEPEKDKLWNRLAKKWARELRAAPFPPLFREDLANVIFRECGVLTIYGEAADDPVIRAGEHPRALLSFDAKRGVPFAKYLEHAFLRPPEEKRRLLADAAGAYLARSPGETHDLDGEGSLFLLDLVCSDAGPPQRLEDLLEADRRNWCFDVAVGVGRTLFAGYCASREEIIRCADERHESLDEKAAAPGNGDRCPALRFLLELASLCPCGEDSCSMLCLLQARLGLDLHGEHPNEERYLAERASVLSAGAGPSAAGGLPEFFAQLNRAVDHRGRVWAAIDSCEPSGWSRLEEYHDRVLSGWIASRVVKMARRIKALLADHATGDADRAASLIRKHPRRVLREVMALADGASVKPGIALGLLVKAGMSAGAARAVLGAAQEEQPWNPNKAGGGLEAVELDVWAELRALECVGEAPERLTAPRVRAILSRAEAADAGEDSAVPPAFAEDVRRYLENFRRAAALWVDACGVAPSLRETARLLACVRRRVYNRCAPELQSALEGFVGRAEASPAPAGSRVDTQTP